LSLFDSAFKNELSLGKRKRLSLMETTEDEIASEVQLWKETAKKLKKKNQIHF
jgi:hypothetical protein